VKRRSGSPTRRKHLLKLGVLVSGRGSNLGAILDAIRRGRLHADVAVVISDRPDAPALRLARARGCATLILDPKTHLTRD